jgi:hypothetical protein
MKAGRDPRGGSPALHGSETDMTTWPLPRIAAAEPLSTGAKLGRRLAAWADGLRAWAGLLHDYLEIVITRR